MLYKNANSTLPFIILVILQTLFTCVIVANLYDSYIILDAVLSTLHGLNHWILTITQYNQYVSILQMEKLRHRLVKSLAKRTQ